MRWGDFKEVSAWGKVHTRGIEGLAEASSPTHARRPRVLVGAMFERLPRCQDTDPTSCNQWHSVALSGTQWHLEGLTDG